MKPFQVYGLRISILLLFIVGLRISLCAQSSTDSVDQRIIQLLDTTWTQENLPIFKKLVAKHCQKDFDCLKKNYWFAIRRLEKQFNLLAAIDLGNCFIPIAVAFEEQEEIARVNITFYRFYAAIGEGENAAASLLKAQRLYEKLGNQNRVNLCEFWKIESSRNYKLPGEVIADLEVFLKQVEAQKDTFLIVKTKKELIRFNFERKEPEQAERYIRELEKLAGANPNIGKTVPFGEWLEIYRYRGQVYETANNLDSARVYFHKALDLCTRNSDLWQETYIREFLANLEWKAGNRSMAKAHLDRAFLVADSLQIKSLLELAYEIKGNFARDEGHFEEAVSFFEKRFELEFSTRDDRRYQKEQNYFYLAEKEALKAEKEQQALHSRRLLTILLISLVFLTLVLLSYLVVRRQRAQLAARNDIIQQQAEELKTLDSAKSRFFVNVSHELRTPLTLLTGPIQTLLEEGKIPKESTQLLQIANKAGKQLELLIDEILDLQKMEMGKLDLQENPTEIVTFLRTYFAQFESLAYRNEIDYQCTIDLEIDLTILLDQEKFRQILYNLFSNAFKFTPYQGRIQVFAYQENEHLALEITDSGSGIHPEDIPNLFDRFFQTNRPEKPTTGGTGIGLALCNEYTKLFGGTMEVESTLGEGATFKVKIPLKPTASVAVLEEESESELVASAPIPILSDTSAPAEKQRVLVVEDNPDLQYYLEVLLSAHYQVHTVGNGQMALDYLTDSNTMPDLILSDLMMPIMDGFQLLEALKSKDETRHIPVIMLTARAELRDKLTALRFGVDDYLIKPFHKQELLVRMNNLLINQRSRMEALGLAEEKPEAVPKMSVEDQQWLTSFESYIRKKLSDSSLSVGILAQQFAMSESTLLRQLKRLTGLTPINYLQEIRLDEGRHLLETRRYNSIAQVADKVGYANPKSFSRNFKQRFGHLPSQFIDN